MPPRFVARQLSHPTGVLGWVVRRGMNRANAGANRFAFDQLDLEPADSVIEIGFGGGPNLRHLIDGSASVVGIDRSADSVAAARRVYAKDVQAGRASFLVGSIEILPIADGACSKALTVHTVYFWPSLERGFAELFRALAPGGIASIGFVPRERMEAMSMPPEIFTMRTPDEVSVAANSVGFISDIRRPRGDFPWIAVVCSKPT